MKSLKRTVRSLSLFVIMMQEKKIFQSLTSESICEIYNILFEAGLVKFPLTQKSFEKLDAIVANINGHSFGVPHYKSIEEKIVAHLYFIIKDHPFTDGNKRTATLVFLVLCRNNSVQEHLRNYDLDSLAVFIERIKDDDHQMAMRVIAHAILNLKND